MELKMMAVAVLVVGCGVEVPNECHDAVPAGVDGVHWAVVPTEEKKATFQVSPPTWREAALGTRIQRWGYLCREVLFAGEKPVLCFAIPDCVREPRSRDAEPLGCLDLIVGLAPEPEPLRTACRSSITEAHR